MNSKELLEEKFITKKAEMLESLKTSIFESDCGCDESDEEECDCDTNTNEELVDVFLNEETGEQYYIELCEETLQERKIIIKVNSKGQRRKKIQCPKGRVVKNLNGKQVCATPTGSERLSKKLSIKQANRTKKAKGTGFKKRTNFKRQKAIRKRRQMGL